MKAFGTARYYRGKLYFDDKGWKMVKAVAKRMKISPTTLVHRALRRAAKRMKNEKD